MALLLCRSSRLPLLRAAPLLRSYFISPPLPLTNPSDLADSDAFAAASPRVLFSSRGVARLRQYPIRILPPDYSASLSGRCLDALGWVEASPVGKQKKLCEGCDIDSSSITMNFTKFLEPIRKEAIGSCAQTVTNTLGSSLCKVSDPWFKHGRTSSLQNFLSCKCRSIHTSQSLACASENMVKTGKDEQKMVSRNENDPGKVKRKKLKGKRAVVRWLKFFRWKKKKEYQRMTAEEKILYKLRKAKSKEDRIVEAVDKLEPKETSETTHDPEILTPEEHFYLLKMGQKCKNYVPVGRRGIFQGVILNMHLHWKKHQTVKVIVKTFTPEEVREIAAELARLSGGIVLDIQEEDTIIMYRGKNYAQPPTEIMSPKITLSRKKALDKSKYRDALRAVRRYIPRLEQELEDMQQQMKRDGENQGKPTSVEEISDTEDAEFSSRQLKDFHGFEGLEDDINKVTEDDSLTESSSWSEPEDLSDMFETDSEGQETEKREQPLYLDEVEKFPPLKGREPENFEAHLREIAAASKRRDLCDKDLNIEDLDDIDKIFLRASSLLKRKTK